MDTSLFPGGSNCSIKEIVVMILSEEWPLSVGQIHERLRRMHAVECSYQAVFKHVKELSRRGILDCRERRYRISLEWLERLYLFVQNYFECYEQNPAGVIGPRAKLELLAKYQRMRRAPPSFGVRLR